MILNTANAPARIIDAARGPLIIDDFATVRIRHP